MTPDLPPLTRTHPIPLLLCAGALVILGTALLDPTRLWLLMIPVSWLMSVYGAGSLLRRFGAGLGQDITTPPLLRTALSLGIGLASLSLVASLCAMGGWFRSAGVILVACFFYGLWALASIDRQMPTRPSLAISLAGGALLGASWLAVWLWATIPPTFYDELTYHLVIPQRALATGQDRLLPWVYHTAMPHASDLLLAWGTAVADEVGGKALHASLWVLVTLSAWGLAELVAGRQGPGWVGPLAVLALASSPTLWFLGTLSFAETALTVAILSIGGLLLAPSPQSRAWLALGLLLGLTASVKLSGLAWVLASLAAAILLGWHRVHLAKTCLLASLCIAPWWIRAWLGTGNPIFPMASGLFASPHWSEAHQNRLKGELPPPIQDLGLDGLLRLPLNLVQHPEQFGSAGDAGILAVAGIGLAAVLPVFARIIGWTEENRRWADAAGTFVWLAGLAWLSTTLTIRFFAPALVVGLIGLVVLVPKLPRPGQAIAAGVMALLALTGTARFIEQQEAAFASTKVALGQETAAAYLARRLDYEAAARFVRGAVPSDARLLLIGDARSLYFAREAMAPYPVSDHPLGRWVQESASPEALAQRIADEGFTHVVLNVREFSRLQRNYGFLAFHGPDAAALDHRLKEFPRALTQLFSKNGLFVFQVARSGGQDSGGGKNGAP